MATARKTKTTKSVAANGRGARRKAVSGVEVPTGTRKSNQPGYGSDAVVELLNGFGFEYAFLNPGSSYRGLQDSIVNYNANVRPKVILGLHEDVVTAMAQGYATASGRPALCILHNLVGLMHGVMGIFNIYCCCDFGWLWAIRHQSPWPGRLSPFRKYPRGIGALLRQMGR